MVFRKTQRKKEKTKWHINLMVLLVTIIVFLILAEIITRIIYGENLQYITTEDTLWELKPNQCGFTIPGKPSACINAFGYRGANLTADHRAYRIMIIGDSFAFGYGVADNETLAAFLEKRLDNGFGQDFEVINLGVPGYGVFQMDALARKKIDEIKPDMVMMVMIKGDVFRQPEDIQGSKFFIKSFLRTIFRKSSFAALMKPKLEFLRARLIGNSKTQAPLFDQYWGFDRDRIANLSAYLDQRNIPFVLVPYIYQDADANFTALLNRDLNATIVDTIYPTLVDYSKSHTEPLQIAYDNHPTPASYQLAADTIIETLINKRMV